MRLGVTISEHQLKDNYSLSLGIKLKDEVANHSFFLLKKALKTVFTFFWPFLWAATVNWWPLRKQHFPHSKWTIFCNSRCKEVSINYDLTDEGRPGTVKSYIPSKKLNLWCRADGNHASPFFIPLGWYICISLPCTGRCDYILAVISPVLPRISSETKR